MHDRVVIAAEEGFGDCPPVPLAWACVVGAVEEAVGFADAEFGAPLGELALVDGLAVGIGCWED